MGYLESSAGFMKWCNISYLVSYICPDIPNVRHRNNPSILCVTCTWVKLNISKCFWSNSSNEVLSRVWGNNSLCLVTTCFPWHWHVSGHERWQYVMWCQVSHVVHGHNMILLSDINSRNQLGNSLIVELLPISILSTSWNSNYYKLDFWTCLQYLLILRLLWEPEDYLTFILRFVRLTAVFTTQ